MSGWQKMCLSDLCSLITDGKHGDCRDEDGSGYYFLSVKGVLGGRLVYDNARQIAESDFLETHQRTNLCPGDILFTNTGTIGRMAIAADDPKTYRTTFQKSVAILKPKQEIILSRLFYYLLQFDNARLSEFAAGTTQKNLLLKDFRTFTVHVPPLSEQRAIASILGALDDKIELNRRMNETLEAMARSLFKSWFVDATQAGLHKDWREGKVNDLATLSRDSLNPGEFPDETFDHYSIPAFDEGRTPKPETGDAIKSNKFIVSPDCVLVSKLNPRIPRVWLPDLRTENRAICSTEFLVATPKPGVSREFLFCLFTNETFISVFTTMVTGTSGSHQRVKPESLLGMDAVIPPRSVMVSFTDATAPLLERINHNIAESRTLAALRDALLPKLLSGELRLPSPRLRQAGVPAKTD